MHAVKEFTMEGTCYSFTCLLGPEYNVGCIVWTCLRLKIPLACFGGNRVLALMKWSEQERESQD
jgi:hypothetical protein